MMKRKPTGDFQERSEQIPLSRPTTLAFKKGETILLNFLFIQKAS